MQKKFILYINLGLLGSLVTMFLSISIISCEGQRSKRQTSENEDSSASSDVYNECRACLLDSFPPRIMSVEEEADLSFDKSIVIPFFNRVKLASKYDNETSADTLMKIFKLKGPGDRNALYSLIDQYFYFKNVIRPALTSNSIVVLDSVKNIRKVEFRGIDKTFLITLSDYQNEDGLLLFTPGRKPIFWTLDREKQFCKAYLGIVEQYFLCPPNAN